VYTPPGGGQSIVDSYVIGAPVPPSGTVQFDVWLDPDAESPYFVSYMGVDIELLARGSGEFRLAVGSGVAGRFDFIPPGAAWYTVKANYGPQVAVNFYIGKVWLRGDPEPGWMTGPAAPYPNVSAPNLTTSGEPKVSLGLAGSDSGGIVVNAKIDNLKIWSSVAGLVNRYLAVDAIFRREVSGSFTFDAILRREVSATFTLDASFVATTTGSFTRWPNVSNATSATCRTSSSRSRTGGSTCCRHAAENAPGRPRYGSPSRWPKRAW
jgi:hypothetical protein